MPSHILFEVFERTEPRADPSMLDRTAVRPSDSFRLVNRIFRCAFPDPFASSRRNTSESSVRPDAHMLVESRCPRTKVVRATDVDEIALSVPVKDDWRYAPRRVESDINRASGKLPYRCFARIFDIARLGLEKGTPSTNQLHPGCPVLSALLLLCCDVVSPGELMSVVVSPLVRSA